MLSRETSIRELTRNFHWEIPEYFNIGVDVCDKWADREPDRLSLTYVDKNHCSQDFYYAELKRHSNQLANLLTSMAIGEKDRVGILLPQVPETAIAHIAVYKLGGIAIPLFTLFGIEALQFRLSDAGARTVITNREGANKLLEIWHKLPQLEHIFCIDDNDDNNDLIDHGIRSLWPEMKKQDRDFVAVNTLASDPALVIYTSGTTGQPKGALHGHRTLLGHLPGVEMSHDFFPQIGDKIWTPADWAWIGGLLDVLLPALHRGVPVVAHRFEKFNGQIAMEFIERHQIRNAFIPPTALKMMRAETDSSRCKQQMRTIASGGETLGAQLLDWGRQKFGLTINEFYGQTECNMIVSSCGAIAPAQPGVMGFAVPGHDVQIVSNEGEICEPGVMGNIAVRTPDPVAFLEYWNNPQATSEKYLGQWLITGDTGIKRTDGSFCFVGRDDDIITSSGYRIGPGEIENTLIGHPAVAIAAVIGKPDESRTEIVKAFIKLNENYYPCNDLAQDLKLWVKTRLAAHEYPREIEFVDSLPMTTTGKIIRRELRNR